MAQSFGIVTALPSASIIILEITQILSATHDEAETKLAGSYQCSVSPVAVLIMLVLLRAMVYEARK